MRRRDFITLLGGAAAAWPLAARAQQSAMPVIGFLGGSSLTERRYLLVGFRQALTEAGYLEGQNVAIEYRWAEGQYDRLPALAADLVRRHVTVIVAGDGPSALAAKAATMIVPIVFNTGIDPIQSGLVTSLARPGGNLTGFNLIAGPLPAKQLGLLHELVPAAKTIAVLINPNNANAERDAATVQEAARAIGVQILVTRAAVESDFETVFATIAAERAGALLANSDVFSPADAIKLSRWRPSMRFPSCRHGANSPWLAASSAMDPVFRPHIAKSAFTPPKFSTAAGQVTCRSCSRRRSSW
jgi:putative ABC transport system substrate-binding protein